MCDPVFVRSKLPTDTGPASCWIAEGLSVSTQPKVINRGILLETLGHTLSQLFYHSIINVVVFSPKK